MGMNVEDNKVVARRVFAALQARDIDAAVASVAEDFVSHTRCAGARSCASAWRDRFLEETFVVTVIRAHLHPLLLHVVDGRGVAHRPR